MERQQQETGGPSPAGSAFMMSLQCPSCDWIWSVTVPCTVEGNSPRCSRCAHSPVLVLKVYSV